MPTIELQTASPDDVDAVRLIEELNMHLNDLYDPDDNHFSLDGAQVTGANGVFLLGRVDGEPAGCGAVRLTPESWGEIKRMFVRPGFRGLGLGRLILTRLESEARDRGATRLVLEMGASQPEAGGLYRSVGFSETPCWGEYLATPASVCLGKDL